MVQPITAAQWAMRTTCVQFVCFINNTVEESRLLFQNADRIWFHLQV